MILDSSALLAFLLDEPGGERVLDAIDEGAQMSVVNFAEVASRYARQGADRGVIGMLRTRLPFSLIPLNEDIAIEAALMARSAMPFGLSLGDRCCLATAKVAGMAALTADRVWVQAGPLLGVEVVSIR